MKKFEVDIGRGENVDERLIDVEEVECVDILKEDKVG